MLSAGMSVSGFAAKTTAPAQETYVNCLHTEEHPIQSYQGVIKLWQLVVVKVNFDKQLSLLCLF